MLSVSDGRSDDDGAERVAVVVSVSGSVDEGPTVGREIVEEVSVSDGRNDGDDDERVAVAVEDCAVETVAESDCDKDDVGEGKNVGGELEEVGEDNVLVSVDSVDDDVGGIADAVFNDVVDNGRDAVSALVVEA